MNYKTAMIEIPLMRDPTGGLMRTPEDIVRLCEDLRSFAQETFHAVLLTTKNTIQNRVMVSLGTLDACPVHPRDVFRQAIIENCAKMIIVHNHPSGDPTPSSEDVKITRRLIEGGKVLGIDVMDSIIIGRPDGENKGWLSMRESGLCCFVQ